MLAKVLPFCLCALFGTNKVTAQLEFGTYMVINQALQTGLCSYHTGEPVFISKPGYSCPRELWELGPGDHHGLYTIRNVGLNSYIRADRTSDSSVVTGNGKTSFAISSAGKNGHIVKFPQGDLVWTVATTMIHSIILLRRESGDDTQLWTLMRADDAIGHKHKFNLSVQARHSQEDERNLAFLRGIEKLGGSAGYQQYLESPHTIPNFTHITTLKSDTLTNSIYASGDLWSVLVYTYIEVYAGEYFGSGYAWGPGLGGIAFIGNLAYNSWDQLTSAENGISIVGGGAGANVLLVLFSVNGNDIAVLTVAGLGGGALFGDRGRFTWTYCGNECGSS